MPKNDLSSHSFRRDSRLNGPCPGLGDPYVGSLQAVTTRKPFIAKKYGCLVGTFVIPVAVTHPWGVLSRAR